MTLLPAPLADALPEMLEDSQFALALYCAGRITAAEYVLLDVLATAKVVDARCAAVPWTTLRTLPGNVARQLSDLHDARFIVSHGTAWALAPDFAARVRQMLGVPEDGGAAGDTPHSPVTA